MTKTLAMMVLAMTGAACGPALTSEADSAAEARGFALNLYGRELRPESPAIARLVRTPTGYALVSRSGPTTVRCELGDALEAGTHSLAEVCGGGGALITHDGDFTAELRVPQGTLEVVAWEGPAAEGDDDVAYPGATGHLDVRIHVPAAPARSDDEVHSGVVRIDELRLRIDRRWRERPDQAAGNGGGSMNLSGVFLGC